jgi:endogenous inhibitor of DNA gyrase (YacG/DUF329 family)
MAMVQIKCPETGEPVDIMELRPKSPMHLDLFSKLVPCPHCGKSHTWTSGMRGLAYQTLDVSPEASRVLVEGDWATALP